MDIMRLLKDTWALTDSISGVAVDTKGQQYFILRDFFVYQIYFWTYFSKLSIYNILKQNYADLISCHPTSLQLFFLSFFSLKSNSCFLFAWYGLHAWGLFFFSSPFSLFLFSSSWDQNVCLAHYLVINIEEIMGIFSLILIVKTVSFSVSYHAEEMLFPCSLTTYHKAWN